MGSKSAANAARRDAVFQAALTAHSAAVAPKPAPSKPKAKSGAKTKAPATPVGPEVAPFFDAQSLLDIGDRTAASETAKADRGFDFAQQAAEATRGLQETELDRVTNATGIRGNTAARGLEHSSIRDGALDTNDAAAQRAANALTGGLAMQATANIESDSRGERADADFMAAMNAKAAENAALIPRAPGAPGAPAPASPAAAAAKATTVKKPTSPAPTGKKKASLIAGAKRLVNGDTGHSSVGKAAQQALAQKRAGNVKGAATVRKGR